MDFKVSDIYLTEEYNHNEHFAMIYALVHTQSFVKTRIYTIAQHELDNFTHFLNEQKRLEIPVFYHDGTNQFQVTVGQKLVTNSKIAILLKSVDMQIDIEVSELVYVRVSDCNGNYETYQLNDHSFASNVGLPTTRFPTCHDVLVCHVYLKTLVELVSATNR